MALSAWSYSYQVLVYVVRILCKEMQLEMPKYRATATSCLVIMTNYLLPACSSDDEPTRLSKELLAMFSVNDNIK